MCHVCQVASPFLGVLGAIGGQVDAACAAKMWVVYLGANSHGSVHSDYGSRLILDNAISATDSISGAGEICGAGCCARCNFSRLCDSLCSSRSAECSDELRERVVGIEAGQNCVLESAEQQRGGCAKDSNVQQSCCSVGSTGSGVLAGSEEEGSSGRASVAGVESIEIVDNDQSGRCGSNLVTSGDGNAVIGKNTLRNRSSRQRRKQRKTATLAAEKPSAFQSCDADIRRMLVETRAERLIEENKRAIAVARGLNDLDTNDNAGLRSAFALCDDATRKKLAESRARRLIAENEQAQERAQRRLEILRASDVTKEIKQDQTRLTAAIERNMVSIEKTHATLVATGNMPGEVGGFAQTIVGSGSISPNSSASLQEFRKCQKDLLDSEEYNARLVAMLKEVGVEVPHTAQSDRDYNREMGIWTDNSENRRVVDEQFPDCDVLYNVHGLEGKMKLIPTVDLY